MAKRPALIFLLGAVLCALRSEWWQRLGPLAVSEYRGCDAIVPPVYLLADASILYGN